MTNDLLEWMVCLKNIYGQSSMLVTAKNALDAKKIAEATSFLAVRSVVMIRPVIKKDIKELR